MAEQLQRHQQQEQSSPSLDDCLKLLRGDRDEQRLAGLLLVTKFCRTDDHESIRRVYDAIGPRFLDRLLRTGLAEGKVTGGGNDDRDLYLQLSVTILAAFCRVRDIAASEDTISRIPSIIQIMMKQPASHMLEECYEILLLVSTASEDGVMTLFGSGGMKVLAIHMPSLPDGSHILELAIRIIQLIVGKIPLDTIIQEYLPDLSTMVISISRQFGILQNALKFELLSLLSVILSSHHSAPLLDALRSMSDDQWATYVRAGVVDILQNRVAPDQKLQALMVAESMISILGEGWLIGQNKVPDLLCTVPSDRCLMLVLESSRVEVAVLLNDLAYLNYEASSSEADAIPVKQRKLALSFSLVEKVIKLIADLGEDEGAIITESTFTKIISGLNETIEVVLDYLKDAKDHGQKKGDILLASVRLIGRSFFCTCPGALLFEKSYFYSYLAETPLASEDKVIELLGYMLSVEGEDEASPFSSACFLMPFMCQTTMKFEGAKILAYSGAYKAVVECLVKLIHQSRGIVEDNGCIFLACDTLMNLLLKRHQISMQLEESVFVNLLKALACWADATDESSVIMMASSICALIFDSTSEEALLRYPDIGESTLNSLSRLIVRSLAASGQEKCDDAMSDLDLHEIITAGYSRWSDRFPHIRKAVGQ